VAGRGRRPGRRRPAPGPASAGVRMKFSPRGSATRSEQPASARGGMSHRCD
jgi:hypothetical protein